jgi:hypothetical protein
MEKLSEISLESANALDASMWQTYGEASKCLSIRAEMDSLLVNLAFSNWTASRDQQIHYLFVALLHLDNIEREILVSDVNDEIVRLERLLDKIRSLRQLILTYIRHLTKGL